MPRSDDGTKPVEGLYRKFTVMRADGSSEPGGKHVDCTYFVLDWRHDPFAIPAALAYAAACEATYPELARDLRFQAHNRPYPKDATTTHTSCNIDGPCSPDCPVPGRATPADPAVKGER